MNIVNFIFSGGSMNNFSSKTITSPLETSFIDLKGSFMGITNSTSLDVIVNIGQFEPNVRIVCQKEIIENLIIENVDEEIEIKFKDNFNFSTELNNKLEFFLPATQDFMRFDSNGSTGMDIEIIDKCVLRSLYLNLKGSGDISLKNKENLKDVKIDCKGSGCVNISEKFNVESLDIFLIGSGDIDAKNLTTNTCIVGLSGSGDIKATVLKKVTANLSGSGDITLFCKPDTNVNTTSRGSGDINVKIK